MAFALWRY